MVANRQKAETARKLACVVLASHWNTPAELYHQLLEACCRKSRGLPDLAREIHREFHGKRPSRRRLADFILRQRGFNRMCARAIPAVCMDVEETALPEMRPAGGAPSTWSVPRIANVAELCAFLNLRPEELAWFADVRQLELQAGTKLQHYRRRWQGKRDGSFRLIESPKQRLKQIQRAVLREILERIPAHDAAHGFLPQRSILTFAGPHAGQKLVLKMDLRDFFPSFSFSRIHHLFLAAGYPERVALLLAGFCTTVCPRGAIRELLPEFQRRARALYVRKHLPQGAPTSPALANLCAFDLDCRLSGLARTVGAAYTRYADDLVFSGGEDFAQGAHRFAIQVMAIALEEGLEVNARKTRVMRQGVRQRAAGLTLNVRPNISRQEFDLLKAILTNCARRGPDGENRSERRNFRAHLEGRIAHFTQVNPGKAVRLQRIFDQIRWP